MCMSDEGYISLANAIIKNCMQDYKQALKCKDWDTIYNCEQFINSDWFAILAMDWFKTSPEKLIDKMRTEFLGKRSKNGQ